MKDATDRPPLTDLIPASPEPREEVTTHIITGLVLHRVPDNRFGFGEASLARQGVKKKSNHIY